MLRLHRLIRLGLIVSLMVLVLVPLPAVSLTPAAALTPAAPLTPAQAQTGGPQAVPNEYILYYEPGVSQADLTARITATGSQVVEWIPQLNAVLVRATTRAATSTLSAERGVTGLEPNLIRHLTVTPNDPGVPSQWALTNINAFSAWDVARGTGQVIAVLDSGVDLDHPDLAAHILPGYDYIGGDTDPSPDPADPDAAHGTHVTGIANAVTDNGIGIAGVAWDARTLPVRISNADGATSANIALGVVYATDHGATVINMSLGGPGWIKLERDAMNYAAAHGVIIVAAAGNDGKEIAYFPASYDHVISVASTTNTNERSSFSNFSNYVDIAAPGSAIYSTLFNMTYGTMSGTSMATPQVAGVAALVQSAGHATTADQVTEALLCSALDLGTPGWDKYFGWGLVQADQAVNYIPGTNDCLPHVPNDDFANANVIGISYTSTEDTSHATSWLDDPRPCVGDTNRTVWYRFTAPKGGTLFLNTVGSTYDTVLSVWTGSRGSLTQTACVDGAQGNASEMQVDVSAGQTYSIMVSSLTFEGGEGILTLNASFEYLPKGCVPFYGSDGTIICTS